MVDAGVWYCIIVCATFVTALCAVTVVVDQKSRNADLRDKLKKMNK